MLAVRIQAIDGARTCTLLDSQHCRLLPSRVVPTAPGFPAGQLRLLHPSRTCIVAFARIGYAIRPTTGNWRSEDLHLARFTALSTAPLILGGKSNTRGRVPASRRATLYSTVSIRSLVASGHASGAAESSVPPSL